MESRREAPLCKPTVFMSGTVRAKHDPYPNLQDLPLPEPAQHTGARFDDPLVPLLPLRGRGGLPLLQVFEARLAGGAAERLQVVRDVLEQVVVEGLQQVAAELVAGGAGDV